MLFCPFMLTSLTVSFSIASPAPASLIQSSNVCDALSLFAEEKAMYSAELDKHKREKEEWRKKAERLADEAAALKVH